jgi:hypothetical protein
MTSMFISPQLDNQLPSGIERVDIHIASWQELIDVLYADTWREQISRFRSNFAFRGVSDAQHDLRTTLARLGGDVGELERHILRSFRKYAHRDAVPGDSLWNWLAVAQHYGAPTRLLDWTYSPFVAMHFATQRTEECPAGPSPRPRMLPRPRARQQQSPQQVVVSFLSLPSFFSNQPRTMRLVLNSRHPSPLRRPR